MAHKTYSDLMRFLPILVACSMLSLPAPTEGEGGGAGETSRGLPCGPNLLCDPEREYCLVVLGGPVGNPPGHHCAALPSSCSPPATCECIAGSAVGCDCAKSGDGITLTCTAPQAGSPD